MSDGRFWMERKAFTRLDFGDMYAIVDSGSTGTDDTATNVTGSMFGFISIGDVIFIAPGPSITSDQLAWTVTGISGDDITATVNTRFQTSANPTQFGNYAASDGPKDLYVFRPIKNTLQWMHDSAGSPHTEKQFRDLQLHFSRHSASSHTVSFTAIDGSTAATGTVSAAAPQAYSFVTTPTLPIAKRANVDDVTSFVTMTPQLAVGMTVNELFAVWTLLGYTLEADDGSEKVMT